MNLGARAARDVVAEIVRIDLAPNSPGSVVLASTPADLEPLGLRGASLLNEGAGAMFACRFSAKGSGSALRGTALVTDGSLTVVDSQSAR